MSRSDLHEAARAYADNGWPVFPLIPRDKRPATRTGFKEATVDPRQIDLWWGANPGYNIGIPTGISFDVLDLDGEVALTALRAFPGFPHGYVHPGPVSLTGRGWHLLFQPTGRGNGADLLMNESKLDFRGVGGYIAASPSIHPSGHQYAWSTGRGPQSPIPQPTDWLLAILDYRGIQNANERANRQMVNRASITTPARQQLGKVPAEVLPPGMSMSMTRPDIIATATEMGLPLWPKGKYVETICIFHDDHSPSLKLYPEKDNFFCFSCGAYGDSYDLKARKPMRK